MSLNCPSWLCLTTRRTCCASVFNRCSVKCRRKREIFVVDNNSSDGSPLMVEIEFPQVKVICSAINLGLVQPIIWLCEAAEGRLHCPAEFGRVSDCRLTPGGPRPYERPSPRGARRCSPCRPGFLMAAFRTHVSPCHHRRACAHWLGGKISKIQIFWTLRPDLGRPIGTGSDGLGPGRLFDCSR